MVDFGKMDPEWKKFKTRLWCGTQHNVDFDWQLLIDKKVLTYVAYGVEKAPTTGKEHHQYWCRFKNTRSSWAVTGKILGGAYTDKIKGTLDQNEGYCNKDEHYIELGVRPKQGERTDLETIMSGIREGMTDLEIAEEAPQQWVQYRRAFTEYRGLLEKNRDWNTEVRVWWGVTGSGKTHDARKWLDNDYDAVEYTESGFFNGYKNNPNVLFDDFTPGMIKRNIMLTMCDQYKMTANVKGGERKWNPRKIAITSNYNPTTWYYGPENEAILRRFDKITHKEKKWS